MHDGASGGRRRIPGNNVQKREIRPWCFSWLFLSSFSGSSCIRFRRLDVVLAAARLAPAARAAWAVVVVVRTATAAAGTTAATG